MLEEPVGRRREGGVFVCWVIFRAIQGGIPPPPPLLFFARLLALRKKTHVKGLIENLRVS